MISLKQWLNMATADERAALAKASKLSVQGLSHIARGHRRGSADTAIAIWLASKGTRLGTITLWSVCPALRKLEPYLRGRVKILN